MGRFTFKTHSVYVNGKSVMNTAKEVFKTLYSKEWYRTVGFNELALELASNLSYRQAANKLNRIRNEKSGTPVRTLSNIVEMEGEKVQEKVDEIIKDILYDNEFSEKGIPNSERIAKGYMPDKRKIRISSKVIAEKIKNTTKISLKI